MRRDPFDRKGFSRFNTTPVAFHGARPNSRPVDITVKCMVVEESPDLTMDAAAPVSARVFNITFPARTWLDATPPHIEDRVSFKWSGADIHAVVRKVSHLPDGDFSLETHWNQKGVDRW